MINASVLDQLKPLSTESLLVAPVM